MKKKTFTISCNPFLKCEHLAHLMFILPIHFSSVYIYILSVDDKIVSIFLLLWWCIFLAFIMLILKWVSVILCMLMNEKKNDTKNLTQKYHHFRWITFVGWNENFLHFIVHRNKFLLCHPNQTSKKNKTRTFYWINRCVIRSISQFNLNIKLEEICTWEVIEKECVFGIVYRKYKVSAQNCWLNLSIKCKWTNQCT